MLKNSHIDCVFCKIAQGYFETEFIFENEFFVVFKDLKPKARLHYLIVPRMHIPTLNDLDKESYLGSALLAGARDLAKLLVVEGYKLQINVGRRGGQEIFHLHLHFLAD